ncbi:MAG: CHASE2 domain-containing protein, partial [Pseudomonadota bacterium]
MTKVFSILLKMIGTPFFLGILLSGSLAWLVSFYYSSYRDPEIVDRYPLLAEIERLHNQTIDFRLRQRGPRQGSEDVAILTIDEDAIQKYGRWPWPRTLIAKVINGVMDGGARSISFDIIFSEKQETILNSLDSIQKDLYKTLPQSRQTIDQVIESQKKLQDHDTHLTSAIESHTESLIMGAVYD